MRTCDLQTGLGQLAHALTHLKERLASVKNDWNDAAFQQFEAAHLGPIPPRLQLLAAAVQRLAAAVEEAERECGDRSGSL
jgi:uncharacterized protein YukE